MGHGDPQLAAAQSVKVLTSILDVTLGSELDEAHEKLDCLRAPGKPPEEEWGDDEEKDRDKHGRKNEKVKEHAATGRDDKKIVRPKPESEEEEGHKILWQFGGTDYSAVYITVDDKELITSITGILRPGKEMPFDKIGETAKAPIKNGNSIVWDMLRPGQPSFRVLAKGTDGKAGTIARSVVLQKPAVMVRQAGKAGDDFR